MGGTRRKNKAPRSVDMRREEPWFKANRRRQRVRDKIARKSRQINYRKAKGK